MEPDGRNAAGGRRGPGLPGAFSPGALPPLWANGATAVGVRSEGGSRLMKVMRLASPCSSSWPCEAAEAVVVAAAVAVAAVVAVVAVAAAVAEPRVAVAAAAAWAAATPFAFARAVVAAHHFLVAVPPVEAAAAEARALSGRRPFRSASTPARIWCCSSPPAPQSLMKATAVRAKTARVPKRRRRARTVAKTFSTVPMLANHAASSSKKVRVAARAGEGVVASPPPITYV